MHGCPCSAVQRGDVSWRQEKVLTSNVSHISELQQQEGGRDSSLTTLLASGTNQSPADSISNEPQPVWGSRRGRNDCGVVVQWFWSISSGHMYSAQIGKEKGLYGTSLPVFTVES